MRIEHTKPKLDGSSSLVLTTARHRLVIRAHQSWAHQGSDDNTFEVDELWLLNEDDEGMTLHEAELDDYFEENFRENF